MGKIIEFKSKYDLDIGTVLWAVGEKDVRIYKPCSTCDDKRSIKVCDDKGNKYDMLCPKCSNKHTKEVNFRDFKHYKAVPCCILGFELSEQFEQRIHIRNYCVEHRLRNTTITNSETLMAEGYGGTTQFYITEEDAEVECKRLNGERIKATREFKK